MFKILNKTVTTTTNIKGITIIEIIVVIAISAIALFIIGTVGLYFLTNIRENFSHQRALSFTEEGIEIVKSIRNNNWSNISDLNPNIDYHPIISGNSWTLQLGSENIDIFTRKIIFENVNRDTNDNIVTSGGVNDPDTKKVTVTVSWSNKNFYISTYLTNF